MCRSIIFTHNPSDRHLTFSNSEQAFVCLEKKYYWLSGKWLMYQFIFFVVSVKWVVSEGIFGWNKLVIHAGARSGLYRGCSNSSNCGCQRISTVLITVECQFYAKMKHHLVVVLGICFEWVPSACCKCHNN